MSQPDAQENFVKKSHELESDSLKRKVIILFFLGLLSMAIIAIGIGWACGDWGRISFGWLNQVFGPALTVGGLSLVAWLGASVKTLMALKTSPDLSICSTCSRPSSPILTAFSQPLSTMYSPVHG